MTSEARIKWGTLFSCCLSCFIAWLDFAIVNTALPSIEQELSATLIQLQWVINAYVLALTVSVVILGRISDHVGRKTMNILGVALFGLSSLFAGLAESPSWLVFFRALQGLGGAAIVPTSLALISHVFPGEEKKKGIGIWSGATGLGMALGPVVGGLLVSTLSWRWIFFINVPISILSILISLLFSKESRHESAALKPDYKGFFLLTIGLSSLTFSLMHAPDWGWVNPKTLTLFAIALIVLVLFYYFENRSTSPTIPFGLLLNPYFFWPTFAMFGLVFVFTAELFLIPLYLIQIRHQPAYQAGLTLLTITASIATLSPLVGYIKLPLKTMMLIGLTFFCLSTLLQIFISPETSLPFLLISFACLGVGWGIARTPTTTSAIASAPHQFAGTATGVLWTIQNAGGAISIAVIVTIFRRIYEAVPSPESFMRGYQISMWLLSAVTLSVIVAISLFMRPKHN